MSKVERDTLAILKRKSRASDVSLIDVDTALRGSKDCESNENLHPKVHNKHDALDVTIMQSFMFQSQIINEKIESDDIHSTMKVDKSKLKRANTNREYNSIQLLTSKDKQSKGSSSPINILCNKSRINMSPVNSSDDELSILSPANSYKTNDSFDRSDNSEY
jgi:hypothetical protein